MFKPHLAVTPDYKRIFVFSDIHGNLQGFYELLEKIKYNPQEDLIVSIGDLIDRGPYSLSVLSYFINSPNTLVVAGNHEELFVQALEKDFAKASARHLWLSEGGEWYKSVDESILRYLSVKAREQFYYAVTITLQCGTVFGLTHGDIIGDRWLGDGFSELEQKELSRLVWSRVRARGRASATYNIKGVDYTVHGHTAIEKPGMFFNSIFIDTGSGFDDGRLTVIELNQFAKTKSLDKSTFSV